jgi:hypothetical protein
VYFDLGESGGLVMALSLYAGSSQYPSDDDCVETNLCDSPMMMSGDVLANGLETIYVIANHNPSIAHPLRVHIK